MKRMKIIIGSCLISILLLSSTTALPQANNQPLMNVLTEIQKQKIQIHEDLGIFENPEFQRSGIIDIIINFIQWIIQIIYRFIDLVADLIGLVNLIDFLINLVSILISMIQQLIDAILNLFPSTYFNNL